MEAAERCEKHPAPKSQHGQPSSWSRLVWGAGRSAQQGLREALCFSAFSLHHESWTGSKKRKQKLGSAVVLENVVSEVQSWKQDLGGSLTPGKCRKPNHLPF